MTASGPGHGRVVLITGASSGIGAALARELALRGFRLALAARRAGRLGEIAGDLRANGAEVAVLPIDLAEPSAPSELVSAVARRFGRLDVLVNNAGMGLPHLFSEASPEDLRRQVDINLVAPILLARLALPMLVESRGVVVNVGSAITAVANPIFGLYGTTKAGLGYWNDALRREVRHRGVRVCLVEPGPVETGFFDAVNAQAGDGPGLGANPPTDSLYNAMRDRPPRLLSTTPEEAARRIAGLIDRPRRRLSFPRRTVWPWRALGALLRLLPPAGDAAISGMLRRIERERSRGGAGLLPAVEPREHAPAGGPADDEESR